jgi:hypothetical protein
VKAIKFWESSDIMQLIRSLLQVFASGYDKNLKVERIVILGLGKPGSRWRAENVGAKQSLETRWGPLYLKPGLPHVALHIRMPNLSVVEEWSLKLKQ